MEQKVFLVDDDSHVSNVISTLLSSVNLACEEYTKGEDFLNHYDGSTLGCIVLDIRLPGMSGIAILEKIQAFRDHLKPIIVTAHGDIPMVVRSMKLGALDFFTKPINNQVLIDTVHKGFEMNSRRVSQLSSNSNMHSIVETLTRRELEVLKLLVFGKVTKEISIELNISPHTVELHRAKIMKKFGVCSVSKLISMVFISHVLDHELGIV